MKMILTLIAIFGMFCIYPFLEGILGHYVLIPWIILTFFVVRRARKLI
jgi:hypothetical protein